MRRRVLSVLLTWGCGLAACGPAQEGWTPVGTRAVEAPRSGYVSAGETQVTTMASQEGGTLRFGRDGTVRYVWPVLDAWLGESERRLLEPTASADVSEEPVVHRWELHATGVTVVSPDGKRRVYRRISADGLEWTEAHRGATLVERWTRRR